MGTQINPMPEENQFSPLAMQFDKDYWAAQPADVQALRELPVNSDERGEAALKLAQSGKPIDVYIHVWGMGPWLAHLIRTQISLPFVGSMQGIVSHDELDAWIDTAKIGTPLPWQTAPKGTLPTVWYDPADMQGTLARLHALYPLPAPPPPPPAPERPIVGSWIYGNVYGVGPGADVPALKDGQQVQQGGKTYTAKVSQGLMGKVVFFTLG